MSPGVLLGVGGGGEGGGLIATETPYLDETRWVTRDSARGQGTTSARC